MCETLPPSLTSLAVAGEAIGEGMGLENRRQQNFMLVDSGYPRMPYSTQLQNAIGKSIQSSKVSGWPSKPPFASCQRTLHREDFHVEHFRKV
jgi:hypothetical protein